jgi:hypothetical protein
MAAWVWSKTVNKIAVEAKKRDVVLDATFLFFCKVVLFILNFPFLKPKKKLLLSLESCNSATILKGKVTLDELQKIKRQVLPVRENTRTAFINQDRMP